MKNTARALLFSFLSIGVVSGCASTDQLKLKEARAHFLAEDLTGAEGRLYSPEVFSHGESRLEHYLWLSSLALSQAQFEKGLFYLERARNLAQDLRSDRGVFDVLSSDYKSNPVEFSYVHGFMVICDLMLADAGETPAWSIPELKDKKGAVVIPAQNFPARKYSDREIADFRSRARSELMAWDSYLTLLKRNYPDRSYYQEDLFARVLGSYVHGSSGVLRESRTGAILAEQAIRNLPILENSLPTFKFSETKLHELLNSLQREAESPSDESKKIPSLVLVQAGVMPPYRVEKTVVGLSTLFKNIQDPLLRYQLEQIGFRVLLQFAPEFGLISLAGAVVGAASSDPEDAPHFLTDAVDQGMGFLVQYPGMAPADSGTRTVLSLTNSSGVQSDFELPIVSPLQEIISTELKNRREKEWAGQAIRVGMQYLAILIPAVKAYQDASRENNLLKKLAILAGYFIAKKAIDRANQPDLRSWSLLPRWISGGLLPLDSGDYRARYRVIHSGVVQDFDLGNLSIRPGVQPVLFRRVGEVYNYGPGKGSTPIRNAP